MAQARLLPDRGNDSEPHSPVTRIEPIIVSASRATDIPAWYGEWFADRLREGGTIWRNPFSGRPQYVSFSKTRAMVFWTKNPGPFFPYLGRVDDAGIGYYVQFTLNDYVQEGLEPNLPPLPERIRTFTLLSDTIGKNRVIWRSDPLLLSDTLTVEVLLDRIKAVGCRIHPYTRKLVISFADIARYPWVRRRLGETEGHFREFLPDEIVAFSRGLAELNREWGLSLATCAEELPPGIDLSPFGIVPNRCIDPVLLRALYPHDTPLDAFLERDRGTAARSPLKDRGQRKQCGCIVAKDIGMYSTCMNLCRYCYANRGDEEVKLRYSGIISTGSGVGDHPPRTEAERGERNGSGSR